MNFARGGGGDHLALLRCYNEWVDTNYSTQWCYENYTQVRSLNKALDIREQLEALCERVEVEMLSPPQTENQVDAVCKAMASGFFYHTSKLGQSGEYRTVKHAHTVYIHPSSCLARDEDMPPWLLYHELAFTSKEYMVRPGVPSAHGLGSAPLSSIPRLNCFCAHHENRGKSPRSSPNGSSRLRRITMRRARSRTVEQRRCQRGLARYHDTGSKPLTHRL